MSRRAVVYKNRNNYTILHTAKRKLYNGVVITVLYKLKETTNFYTSMGVWAFCARDFKAKKSAVDISFDIPVLTNELAISFLEKSYYKNRLEKFRDDYTDEINTLSELFPNKELKYLPKLENFLRELYMVDYKKLEGTELDYIKEINTDACRRMHITHPFDSNFFKGIDDYYFENHNLTDMLHNIGKHTVTHPMAFSKSTADWYKKEYGRTCPYAHAGEIFFVTTDDSVYFTTNRHF